MQNAGGMAAFISEWGGTNCNYCHIGEGYLNLWDPSYASSPLDFSTTANMITCGICHDAHDMHTDVQLRAEVPIVLPNPDGYTITGWGMGLMCGNCHRDRRTPSQIQTQLNNGSTHFGPHDGPQADMVEGTGTYEIPGSFTWSAASQHTVEMLPNMCVSCHVVAQYPEGGGSPTFTGHTFMPQLSTCQNCHPGATDFNIGGVQDAVTAKLSELEAAILAGPPALSTMDDVGDTSLSSYQQREAAWAWLFVTNDKSMGVHNRDYALLILQNSIDYLATVAGKRSDDNLWGVK